MRRDMSAAKLSAALRQWGNLDSKMVELPQNLKPFIFDTTKQKSLSEIYLDNAIKTEIYRFIKERDKLEVLRDAGLPMRNRILLAGPPGNGKTSLAGAIGKELGYRFMR
ncbi:MAG: AAA family ATPase [Veillonellales bacterium]